MGIWDSLILMVLALVVFGPRRLPQIGRQIGKLMYEFRKASNDFKFQMEEELRNAEEADRRKKEEERSAALALATRPAGIRRRPRPVVCRNPLTPGKPLPGEGVYPPDRLAAEAPGESPIRAFSRPRPASRWPPSGLEPGPAQKPLRRATPRGPLQPERSPF
jgi:sec-independent protein translocase protein TatB